MSPGRFQAEVLQREGFRFDVTFDDETWAPIVLDEPEPLGTGAGPNATRMLAAAIGNCLAASLLLCLDKARVDAKGLRARVEGTLERNESGRLRVVGIDVVLGLEVSGERTKRYDRCLELFEDFCIVTQSVREGIEVDVRVEPVFESAAPSDEVEPTLRDA